ncbi:P-loop containing nucleoside triphosphate hydrolase protein [Nemania sp. FL0031]|nr:P-loop containing nucleoside triphosphate hydrolase protein [Nemania sp. FL0031]
MATITKLYRHDCNRNCPQRWSKFTNHTEDQQYIQNITAEDSIIHRHVFRDNKWNTSSFTIQSSPMRAQLLAALSNYHAFDPELENWTFKPPFKPIVHRWEKLNAIDNGTTEPSVKEASSQLMDFLRPIVASSVDALAKTKQTGMIAFEDLWQIFSPGDVALTVMYDVVAACRITNYERHERYRSVWWVISLEYVDWNGERCGYANTEITIYKYIGLRHVTSLPVYPISFMHSSSEFQDRLVARGRIFEALRGSHFRACTGKKILLETAEPEERQVDNRVVIDAYAFYLSRGIVKPTLSPLGTSKANACQDDTSKDRRPLSRRSSTSSSCSSRVDSDEDRPPMTATKKLNKAIVRVEVLDKLTDEECLLATPWVKGFDLKTKEWAQFCVDDLSPVVWNDAAFDQLALPGQKELAWEFVENNTMAKSEFDDFIQDKGRGIIILMFGPPGVGKTFTAEAVSERAHVPLYSVSAGALGTAPKEVEASLDKALNLCKLWNAILLLDEADIFLGVRTNNDLARNELVAVFLTKLEYFAGVCFLTTNRVGTIDGAFQSRVDLFLQYKDLTEESRRQVWESFINRAGRGKFNISDSDLDELARFKLNGREIKNLIKSAHLLSLKSEDRIGLQRLKLLSESRINALELLGDNPGI